MKNKIVLTLSCIFSLLFLAYVVKVTEDIRKTEETLIASPNVIDVTNAIRTWVLVSDKELPPSLWAAPDADVSGWKTVKIPNNDLIKDEKFKEGSFAYYRILIPKSQIQKLPHLKGEISFGPQYLLFSKVEIFVNGRPYVSNTPTDYNESIVNIPLREEKDYVLGIKGYIRAGDTGISHRGQILLGKGAELNELHRKAYKRMTIYSLIFVLCKGSVLFVFTLIYLFLRVDRFFEKSLLFSIFVLCEDVLTGDYLNTILNYNQKVVLYNFVNWGVVYFLFLFLMEVMEKTYPRRIIRVISLALLSIGVLMTVDVLYLGKVFTVDHVLRFWNLVLTSALLFYLPQVFKKDKVLFLIMSLAFGLTGWSAVFAGNVAHNLKALGNLLLFFMVAYQTFILFRREQELLKSKQAQLLEQEKDVAIGKTASMLAHDVRRPLAQMNMILDRLAAGETSSAFIKTAKKDVSFSLTSVNNLINDIMNFSKTSKIFLSGVAFHQVLAASLKQVLTINRGVNISVEYDFRTTEKVLAEESRLASLLTNLISNAVEAIRDIGDKTDGIIKIKTELKEGKFSFSIFNDGPPIPIDVINQIFKPLFTHGKSKGTGLGLASVLKIVQEHQGSIEVKNIDGSGVEFIVGLLPAGGSEVIDWREFPPSSKDFGYFLDEKEITVNGRGLRILLLDDDSQVFEYLRFLVKDLKFEVELKFAPNITAAREQVKSRRFDLYILDFDLGDEKNGFDFYQENLSFLTDEVIFHTNRERLPIEESKFILCNKPMSFQKLQDICESVYKKRSRILVVDDSQLSLMIWEMYHGRHNIDTVSSPEEALVFLESRVNEVDLCVLDYYFDNSSITGEELARRILASHPEMKVFISSNLDIALPNLRVIRKNEFEIRKYLRL